MFNKRIITDIKKNNYAIKNGFNYLRISYKEQKYLKEYLKYFMNKIKLSDTQQIMYSNTRLYKNTYLFKFN